MIIDQDAEECPESLRLDVEIAGGPDQTGEVGFRKREEAPGCQATCSLEIGNGTFDVGPAGVLREDGADADFKGSFTGPPVLMAKVGVEEVVRLPERVVAMQVGPNRRRAMGCVLQAQGFWFPLTTRA